MSHTTLPDSFAMLYAWLLLLWSLQSLAMACAISRRGWGSLLVPGLISAGVLSFRVDGMALARWAANFTGNFSIPFAGLVIAAVWERTFAYRLFAPRDWIAGWTFGLISGLLLYPLAMGWGQVDPYAWGRHFSLLFIAGAILTGLLIWKRNRLGLLLLLSIAGFRLHVLESDNYWDYIVDPIYCLVSIPALGWALRPRKMTLELQRRLDSLLGPLICAALSFMDQFRPKPPPGKPVRKILVILLSEMGSMVLAHAMFVRLKQRYPDASIHALLFTRHREALDLMALVPEENVLTIEDRSLKKFAVDGLKVLFRLRSLRFDAAIDCELFARISSILSYLSGARLRVGFHRHTQEGLYRGSFINRPVMYNPYRHLSQQFLALAEAIDSDTVPLSKNAPAELPGPPPFLDFPPDELKRAASQLYAHVPSIHGKVLVLVYPSGGALPIRAWPLEHYFVVCQALLADGYAVGVLGLPTDREFGQRIVARCRDEHCVDLTGYTVSIRHLLAVFHEAALVITADGGPAQFVALTPVPAIVLFGPETPLLYRPLGRAVHCFHLSLPCSPCLTAYNHRTSPCDGDNRCLKQITPDQVLAKARQLLPEVDPAIRSRPRPAPSAPEGPPSQPGPPLGR